MKKTALAFGLYALTILNACKPKDNVILQRPEEDGYIPVSQTQETDSISNKKQNLKLHLKN